MVKLKYKLVDNSSGTWGEDPDGPHDTIVLRSTDQTLDGGWRISDPAIRAVDPVQMRRLQLKEGDILVTKSSGSEQHIGKASLVTRDVALLNPVFSNFNQRLRLLPSEDPRFYWYVLNSDIARHYYRVHATTTSGLGNLTATILGNLPVPAFDLSAQRRIADFLDRETARIDELIEKKERFAALLQTRLRARTWELVTHGVNRSATQMKAASDDLPVPVPSHWQVMPLKYVATLKAGHFISADQIEPVGLYPVYGGNGVRGYTSSFSHEGDFVLIGRQGALCGNINYATGRFWASEHAVVVNPKREVDVLWLGELLRSMDLNRYSMSAAQPGLSVSDLMQIKIPVPPLDEQRAIAGEISLEQRRISVLTEKIHASIKKLRELRTALVTAAVTGQVDFHQWRRQHGFRSQPDETRRKTRPRNAHDCSSVEAW